MKDETTNPRTERQIVPICRCLQIPISHGSISNTQYSSSLHLSHNYTSPSTISYEVKHLQTSPNESKQSSPTKHKNRCLKPSLPQASAKLQYLLIKQALGKGMIVIVDVNKRGLGFSDDARDVSQSLRQNGGVDCLAKSNFVVFEVEQGNLDTMATHSWVVRRCDLLNGKFADLVVLALDFRLQ